MLTSSRQYKKMMTEWCIKMSRTTLTFILGVLACACLGVGAYIANGYYCSTSGGLFAFFSGLGTGVCALLAYSQGGGERVGDE